MKSRVVQWNVIKDAEGLLNQSFIKLGINKLEGFIKKQQQQQQKTETGRFDYSPLSFGLGFSFSNPMLSFLLTAAPAFINIFTWAKIC